LSGANSAINEVSQAPVYPLDIASAPDVDPRTRLNFLLGDLRDCEEHRLAVLEEEVIGAVPADGQVRDTVFITIGYSVPVCLRKILISDQ